MGFFLRGWGGMGVIEEKIIQFQFKLLKLLLDIRSGAVLSANFLMGLPTLARKLRLFSYIHGILFRSLARVLICCFTSVGRFSYHGINGRKHDVQASTIWIFSSTSFGSR